MIHHAEQPRVRLLHAGAGHERSTGGEVDLVSADINVSGPAGGGSVEIGGGAHGGGDLPHAQIVFVDSNSSVDADATGNGSGGSIALWSEGTTSDAATLTARGGPLGGDGGYIETSGYFLQVSAAPNASAPHGNAGTWVMDPINIDIQNGTGTGTFTGPVVFNADIDAALNGGTSVVIDTSNQTNGSDPGTLTQESDAIISVAPTSDVSLTLRANSDMILHGGITASGSSTLSVELDQLNSTGSAVTIDTNPININGTFKVVGGNLSLASGISLAASAVTVGPGTVIADSGSVAVTVGTVTLDSPVTTTGGNVSLNATGAVSIGAEVNTGGGGFAVTTGGNFENDAEITDGGSNASNNPLTVNASSGTGTINVNGAISWAGTGGVDIEGASSVTSTASGTITSEGSTGVPVWLFTTGVSSGAGVTVGAAVNTNGVFTAGGGAFTLGADLTANSASINLAATTTLDSKSVTSTTVNINDPIDATASTGQVLIGGSSFTSAATNGTITTTDGNVTMTNSGGTTINASVVTGGGKFSATGESSFTTTTSGTLTTSGGKVTISTAGAVSIQAGVNTGGGGFAATAGGNFENDAEITDGGTNASNNPLTVNTSSGTGTVDINGAISWAGSGGVDIEGATTVTSSASGTITSEGSTGVPVSLFTTGVSSGNGVTVGAAVNTNGVFTASGGAFTLGADLSAGSASINLAANTTLDGKPVTSSTVNINDPIASVGQVLVGGTSFTSATTTGTIAITDGNMTMTNSGGTTINASVATGGGKFSATGGSAFTTNAGGTINTAGTTDGEVDIELFRGYFHRRHDHHGNDEPRRRRHLHRLRQLRQRFAHARRTHLDRRGDLQRGRSIFRGGNHVHFHPRRDRRPGGHDHHGRRQSDNRDHRRDLDRRRGQHRRRGVRGDRGRKL